jgi:predicted permease
MRWIEQAWQDIRLAVRAMIKNPGFTLATILSLALGIGAATAVFSIIYAVLFHPYPYKGADRMVTVRTEDRGGNRSGILLTGVQFEELRQAKSVEDTVGWQSWDLPLTATELPEDVRAEFFTSNAAAYFGVPPLLGRNLLPSDAAPGRDAEPVAVLSYQFWARHFDSSPAVLGKNLQLLHKNYTIVGVLPPRFAWNGADVYLPLKISYDPQSIVGFSVRLKPGVRLSAANAEFDALFHQFAKQNPGRFAASFRVRSEPLNERYGQSLEHALLLLLGAVLVVLLIGCANVSILLLARGTSRQRELAVRAAIGASRARILRQLLTESLVLAVSGAVLGVMMAGGMVQIIVLWLPYGSYPQEAAIGVNVPVLIFSVGLGLVTSIFFGLWPALRLSRSDAAEAIQLSSQRIVGTGTGGRRAHAFLIAGQMALTLVLLTAASAAMEGLMRLTHSRLGYDPSHTINIGIPIHPGTYTNWQARAAYFHELRRRIAVLPEVVSVANSLEATPPTSGVSERFEIMGRPGEEYSEARLNLVSAEYFSVLHTPLLEGRLWSDTETTRGAHVALIGQTMARRYWPNGDAVGHAIRMPELKSEESLRIAAPGSDRWFQIVGIVADARNDGLLKPAKPAIYLPYTIWMGVEMDLLVRTRVSPRSVLRPIRKQIQAVDSNQEVDEYTPTLEELIRIQPEWQREHLVTILFGAFAVLALSLAVAGLYSVVSYVAAQRTNEFGIRMALGAQRSDVLRSVLFSTTLSVGSGIAAGLALAAMLNPLLAKWAEGNWNDPLILLAVALGLTIVAALAGLLPAKRAAGIDPMTALRHQ